MRISLIIKAPKDLEDPEFQALLRSLPFEVEMIKQESPEPSEREVDADLLDREFKSLEEAKEHLYTLFGRDYVKEVDRQAPSEYEWESPIPDDEWRFIIDSPDTKGIITVISLHDTCYFVSVASDLYWRFG